MSTSKDSKNQPLAKLSELPEKDDGEARSILRKEIYNLWSRLDPVTDQEKIVNTTNCADWLTAGEELLKGEPLRRAHVMYCISRARFSLAKASECSKSRTSDMIALTVGFVYLIGLPLGIHVYAEWQDTTISAVMKGAMVQVPFFVFVWGFLGGTSWSIYSAAYWSKRRLFDDSYLGWHVAHPFVSAVLGAAVSLVVLGGLTSLGDFVPGSLPGSALLSLISFVAGFSTNTLWKYLDRTVRKLLGLKGSGADIHDIHQKVVVGFLENIRRAPEKDEEVARGKRGGAG